MISKLVGGTLRMQLVSAPFGRSKNERAMAYAHAFAASDGLPNATWAMLGMVTTVEFGSVRATYGPNDGAVWASYWAEMTSVGMLLRVISRTTEETFGTFHAAQFSRMNDRLGASFQIATGNFGNARRPDSITLFSVSYGTHSPQATPLKTPWLNTPIPAGSTFGAAQVDAIGAGSPWASASIGCGDFRGEVRPGRHRPLHEHATADHHVYRSRTSRHADFDGLRRRLILADQTVERRADVSVALPAA